MTQWVSIAVTALVQLVIAGYVYGRLTEKVHSLEERVERLEGWQDKNFRGVAAGK